MAFDTLTYLGLASFSWSPDDIVLKSNQIFISIAAYFSIPCPLTGAQAPSPSILFQPTLESHELCWEAFHTISSPIPAMILIRVVFQDSQAWMRDPVPRLNIKTIFPGMGIPMLKIRQSQTHVIFNMGIPILVSRYLYIETGPWETEPYFNRKTVYMYRRR